MKWHNTNKLERRSDWYTVRPPARDKMRSAKAACKENLSSGKFYYHYSNTRWWFEKEEDAIWFALITE